MKFHSFVSFLLACMASLFVAGCGGGGATPDPNKGGELQISPVDGSFYAGVVSTITISGGRAPYALTSSEPTVLAVPPILDGHFLQVVPNNPGVVDSGLTDTDVPRRTVIITVRDSQGLSEEASIKVIRNFLTGYLLSFGASTCPVDTKPCAGGDTIVQMSAITNGTLHGNELFRFESVRGGCSFVEEDGTLKSSVLVRSSHEGIAQALLRCPANSAGAIGLIRVTHVASGVTADHAFVISATGASTGGLTAVPETFTFTGPNDTTCGTGSFDAMIFGGQAPYTATSASPNAVSVSPASSSSNPGRFTITAFNPNTCVDTVVVVQDASGAHVEITVITELGTVAGPAPPTPATFDVQPAAIVLSCATTGSVTAVGGSGTYAATSTHPRVFALVSGNTVSITRCGTGAGDPRCSLPPAGVAGGADFAGGHPTTATVSVTDGATIKPVAISGMPANCP